MFNNLSLSAVGLRGMLIELRDSRSKCNCTIAADTLKVKLRFYFANVIVNDNQSQD